jgi:hypothetical protein
MNNGLVAGDQSENMWLFTDDGRHWHEVNVSDDGEDTERE